jgi:G3E family GTPase
MTNQKIPVTILTGFLGSGKTTLLNHILQGNHGKKIAVIENEFGEIGIDNELVIGADEEIFEMNNGCICCTVRGDLIRILTRLTKRKDKLDMILVETTGMANPAPVAQTFWVDADLKEQFSLDAIVTIIDAKHVHLHMNDSSECKEQIAFADVVLLNKQDLVSEEESQQIHSKIRSMNSMCEIYPTTNSLIDLDKILNIHAFDLDKKVEMNPHFSEEEFPFEAIIKFEFKKGKYTLSLDKGPDPSIDIFIAPFKNIEAQKLEATIAFSTESLYLQDKAQLKINQLLTLNTEYDNQSFEFETEGGSFLFFTQHGPDEFNMEIKKTNVNIEPLSIVEIAHSHSHDDEISSVGIVSSQPLNVQQFNRWMGYLLQTYGQNIFRCKGILYFAGYEKRVVFQGVHMLFDAQPDRAWSQNEEKKSQLIFIGKDLDRNMLNEGFKKCLNP